MTPAFTESPCDVRSDVDVRIDAAVSETARNVSKQGRRGEPAESGVHSAEIIEIFPRRQN